MSDDDFAVQRMLDGESEEDKDEPNDIDVERVQELTWRYVGHCRRLRLHSVNSVRMTGWLTLVQNSHAAKSEWKSTIDGSMVGWSNIRWQNMAEVVAEIGRHISEVPKFLRRLEQIGIGEATTSKITTSSCTVGLLSGLRQLSTTWRVGSRAHARSNMAVHTLTRFESFCKSLIRRLYPNKEKASTVSG